jgi:peptidoglycan/LPS O-acetylase OafA/YrhL
MDPSLFQFASQDSAELSLAVDNGGSANPHASAPVALAPASTLKMSANSPNLDFLRSYAVILVVGFHVAKFFDWRFGRVRLTDFGLLGVMLFFVHTTLVLMFSLERQSASGTATLFVPFMIRRCFRVYPLAALVVICAFLFRIPSDLQFGKFTLLHQSPANLLANLLLIQNVTLQKANPGVLWSLPLELQMYLVLPVFFLFVSRVKSPWVVMASWWLVVGLWYAAGFSSGMLPLSDGGIRSPMEALLKFTRFAPCFLPGIVAYKLWTIPRLFAASAWPVFLALCSAAFVWFSGRQPIESGWFVCFGLGAGVCLFRELPGNALTWLTKRIARYSYGIYLLHYFAIWLAFAVCRRLNVAARVAIFLFVLTALSVLLYHTVEAPLIAAGVRWSERFKSRVRASAAPRRSCEAATQTRSYEAGSL